jgi:hypothetical protein
MGSFAQQLAGGLLAIPVPSRTCKGREGERPKRAQMGILGILAPWRVGTFGSITGAVAPGGAPSGAEALLRALFPWNRGLLWRLGPVRAGDGRACLGLGQRFDT